MVSAASFSLAQRSDEMHGKLMAKASTKTSATYTIGDNMTIWGNSASPQSRDTGRIYRSELSPDPFDPASLEQSEDSGDVSLAIVNELKPVTNPDLKYQSPALKAEDLPLVMSTADRKTTSVVLPPFLYFKTEF